MKLTEKSSDDRNLVLIDIENLAGAPCPTAQQVEGVKVELRAVITDLDQSPCVVACSHKAALVVSLAFPHALRRWRSGKDGADWALMCEMDDLRVMTRYRRITLCSGDGIFTESVAALGRAGVETTVISLEGHLSKRLELAAGTVVTLPRTDVDTPVTAARSVA
jgi:uncharacterized LabA/DUF88 family protein